MSVTEVKKLRSVIGTWGPGLRQYTISYAAITDADNDGPLTVLQSNLMPQLFQTPYEYGNDSDNSALLVDLSIPQRDASGKHWNRWRFDGVYEFNVQQIPEMQPVQVVPFYLQTTEPITAARFVYMYEANNGQLQQLPFNNPVLNTGDEGPVCSSNGVPVVPAPERRVAIPGYRVSWLKRTEFDYSSFINSTNDGTFTLVGYDKIQTSHEGLSPVEIFNRTFAAFELFLADVQTGLELFYDRYYYRYTLEFWRGDWLHYELNRGITERADVGDDDGRGGSMNAAQFPPGVPKQRQIHDANGKQVTEPMLLDETGKLIVPQKPDDATYGGWEIAPTSSFPLLNIGATD